MKPYYQDDQVTIYHGDCLEVLPGLLENSIPLIISDPPYNIGYHYESYSDRMEEKEYLEFQVRVLQACERVLAPSGSLFYLHYHEFNSLIYSELIRFPSMNSP